MEQSRMTQLRVNIGCGTTPIDGWLNFDNSLSVRLSRLPIPEFVLPRNGSSMSLQFLRTAKQKKIKWADATKLIPLKNESVEVLYSSHMIEHLDRNEARAFLREAHRVLMPEGLIRIAAPDLNILVTSYLEDQNADRFIEKTLLAAEKSRTLRSRLKLLLLGARHHHWMYDGASLTSLLAASGFKDVAALPAGETRIQNPGPLDLRERYDESIYVEAIKA